MGKATITANNGDGHYTITLVEDTSGINARITKATNRITEIDNQLVDLDLKISTAYNEWTTEKSNLDTLIANYNAGTASKQDLVKQSGIVAEKKLSWEALKKARAGVVDEKVSLESLKKYLNRKLGELGSKTVGA